jgi:hypothetical protein
LRIGVKYRSERLGVDPITRDDTGLLGVTEGETTVDHRLDGEVARAMQDDRAHGVSHGVAKTPVGEVVGVFDDEGDEAFREFWRGRAEPAAA